MNVKILMTSDGVVPPFLPRTPAVASTAAENSDCLFPCLSRTDVNAWCAFGVQISACYAERLPHIRGCTAVERCGRDSPDANSVLVGVKRAYDQVIRLLQLRVLSNESV